MSYHPAMLCIIKKFKNKILNKVFLKVLQYQCLKKGNWIRQGLHEKAVTK